MKASNAGAILLIGFGVLMLNLAYTGRASAVWDALRGSEPAASTGDEPPPADAGGEPREGDNPGDTPGAPDDVGRKPRGQAGHGVGWRTVRIN